MPDSWGAADEVRALDLAGLIDPSRRQPGLWLAALFSWNAPGAPEVRRVGAAEPIVVPVGYR